MKKRKPQRRRAREWQVWECRIIVPAGKLPYGLDWPPRAAAVTAIESAGVEVLACYSGWAASLPGPIERDFVAHVLPYKKRSR